MISPKKIFLDTTAWVEFILKKERYHQEIYNYLSRETKSASHFFTSDYVLDETYTRLLTNQSISSTKIFKNLIYKSEQIKELVILFTDKSIFEKSWVYFEKFSEHKLSFTDATIYTFVKDLKIDEVLSLDQGFKKIGLKVKPNLR